jgi:hypothetical protein
MQMRLAEARLEMRIEKLLIAVSRDQRLLDAKQRWRAYYVLTGLSAFAVLGKLR